MPYDHATIEPRWQAYWDEHQSFEAKIDEARPKYYVLDMFPYPSGSGLHVGHPEGYTATDIMARYKRMRGFNVLHPMGWDSFGLPAERYAMKTGTHPRDRTYECIDNFKRQLKMLGFSYDWSREIATTDPDYYKWTQWIFLQIWGSWYDAEQDKARPISELPIPAEVEAAGDRAVHAYRDEHRLAYLHDAPVNWCPDLRVVLANEEVAEQVEAGHEVIRVPMHQWMLKITAYAQRLIDDLDDLDWSPSVLEMQRNWICRSEGAEVVFELDGQAGPDAQLRVFTTRPDTLFGATYMVLAPEHPLVSTITTDAQRDAVEAYVKTTAHRTERERQVAAAEGDKTGVFTGAHAINPVNDQRIPIWIADYVLMGYGTGAIMAVPGHDARDHAFARTMGLPIVQVVAPATGEPIDVQAQAYPEPGVAVNSGLINDLPTAEAKQKITEWLTAQAKGEARVNYKLRDWLFSRQRYWGEPFPLIHKPSGEVASVGVDALPVELPEVDDFNPSETGEPPLAKALSWVELPDGSRRETNTMPQWAGSCWYYLRFCDPRNASAPWSSEAEQYWMPVDLYVGGAEHAVLHLLYARFWHKVLFDLGHVSTREPFKKLVNQGMVLGATYVPRDPQAASAGPKRVFVSDEVEEINLGDAVEYVHKQTREPLTIQWDKMSKSRGNVINPDEVIAEYGADTMRLYEMFMGPLEASAPWQPEGVAGCFRFLGRAYRLFFESPKDAEDRARDLGEGQGSERQRRLLHRTIADVSERIERMAFNTAISSLMVFVRDVEKDGETLGRDAAGIFCQLLAPFAPHLAEELWRALGNPQSLTYEPWPQADPALLVEDSWTLVVQVNGKRRGELKIPASLDPKQAKDEITELAMASEAVSRFVGDKPPKRVIYVPGRLVNIVLG
ncbi:leucine--tRNA ligase [Enhygromyxa salina]|uniref:Leucine--tRNA ligase n=1 Tax=Enhygromyxa salina TaxID=215803 RepID=A0A2S9Y0J1_9BACT|nr:leucine--tRNA ligase [Enhygromyxa salina]PRP98637.1 Leucine--tRNA ligase [Enhygromyxa salina]